MRSLLPLAAALSLLAACGGGNELELPVDGATPLSSLDATQAQALCEEAYRFSLEGGLTAAIEASCAYEAARAAAPTVPTVGAESARMACEGDRAACVRAMMPVATGAEACGTVGTAPLCSSSTADDYADCVRALLDPSIYDYGCADVGNDAVPVPGPAEDPAACVPIGRSCRRLLPDPTGRL